MNNRLRKQLYRSLSPCLPDSLGHQIAGRCIGYTGSEFGLAAIYVFPHVSGKYLYVVNPANPLALTFLRPLDEPSIRQTSFPRRTRRVYR